MNAIQNGCKNCTKQFPYEYTYRLGIAALEATGVKTVDVADILAICWRESLCTAWFYHGERLFDVNLTMMEVVPGFSRDEFLRLNAIASNNGKVACSKFRFEHTWFDEVERDEQFKSMSLAQRLTLACSWGIAQKGALYLVRYSKTEYAPQVVAEFQRSVDTQLKQLCFDLNDLMSDSAGDKQLAYTRYNSGASAKRVTAYGKYVAANAAKFRTQLNTLRYPLCSTST